ncbi:MULTISPECIES: universal stress protein [unclassified Gordonia (in: high G+C Gram-positive bacteria)]|uniref:universal stress protein n=1 Tax=unclassified Gordonia (in: high G+C Gram-positive bacteria) TaxID=2657482 RepID=UPI001F0E7535|nr:universal stress protein [Gordonia sp. ABSL49_1]MCH5643565.1 universal stress protein [Gordonia sp. ABSL49_1]
MSTESQANDTAPNPLRLTVGYLATPSGNDGVALACALASATGAAIDLVCVVKPMVFDGSPGLDQYQERLENQAAQWLSEGAARIPDGVETRTVVVVNESFAAGLIGLAEQAGAAMIVVGGTNDGVLRRHSLGTVSTELLHSSPLPVALAPRSYADRENVSLDMITVAVPVKQSAANPLPFALELAELGRLDLRLLSLVSLDSPFDDDSARAARAHQVSVAKELLEATKASVDTDLDVDVVVADGSTLDEALDNLTWDQNDLVAVGSGHLGADKRVFLGSTAARILRWTTAPVIVTPKD